MRTKPFRFSTGLGRPPDRDALAAAARTVEALGYSTVGAPDHFMIPLAPLLALQAAADATTTVRLNQIVLNHDLRHPAVLAKELATLDVLSGGRLEVGIGAGWMRAEYEQSGMTFDPAPVRIERLEEVVVVLRGLFADDPFTFAGKYHTIRDLDGLPKPQQRPAPPVMIGGGGRKLLSVAGRQADIVQVMPTIPRGALAVDPAEFTADAHAEKVSWVKDAAGARFDDLELGTQLLNLTITDDADAALDAFIAHFTAMIRGLGGSVDPSLVSADALIASPVVAIGTLDAVCEKLRRTRAEFGFSYIAAPVGATPQLMAPVIGRLAGT